MQGVLLRILTGREGGRASKTQMIHLANVCNAARSAWQLAVTRPDAARDQSARGRSDARARFSQAALNHGCWLHEH